VQSQQSAGSWLGRFRAFGGWTALIVGALAWGCGPAPIQAPPPKTGGKSEAPRVDDDALAGRYQAAKERIAGIDPVDPMGMRGALNELGPQLREIAESAKAAPLRANASLLLGSLYQSNGDRRSAIAFYRQAGALLPGEIEPVRVLALALGADGQFAEAAALQRRVVEDDADDLAAWLLLGELLVKSGEREQASAAYIAYEIRRKGLIDGLTLRGEEGFVKGPGVRGGADARGGQRHGDRDGVRAEVRERSEGARGDCRDDGDPAAGGLSRGAGGAAGERGRRGGAGGDHVGAGRDFARSAGYAPRAAAGADAARERGGGWPGGRRRCYAVVGESR